MAPTAPAQPSPIIIGLTGYARSGKDSVGQLLVERHGFRRVAFGDTLKDIAEDMNPLIKHTVDGVETVSYYNDLLVQHGGREGIKDAVPESRQYLVDLGNSLRHRITGVEISATFGTVLPGDRVVNTNVYHGEEIDAIRAMGGIMLRVRREGFGPANVDEARTGKHPVDAMLYNDGDFETLAQNLQAVLSGLGIDTGTVAHAAAR
jgi:hypothetical protein